MIRVLVVDDSATAREAISAMLESDQEIRVIGEATNGLEAVRMAAFLKPDAITMDINMPEMNGDEATKQIMAQTPTPIVVVSTVNHQEMVHHGFDLLLSGALEIVQKPSSLSELGFGTIRSELITKVKAISQIKLAKSTS